MPGPRRQAVREVMKTTPLLRRHVEAPKIARIPGVPEALGARLAGAAGSVLPRFAVPSAKPLSVALGVRKQNPPNSGRLQGVMTTAKVTQLPSVITSRGSLRHRNGRPEL